MGNPLSSGKLNITSNQVKWDGPNILCLDLCTGDTVSSVVYKIAEHLCSIVQNIEDLKTLDLKCVLEDCASSCDLKDYSLKALFEVLLANDCKLQELITSIESQIEGIPNGGIILTLDLACLEQHFINLCITSDYTLNDLLQCFVNILCDHEVKIKDITERIQSLEVLITNLQNIVVTGIYTEPSFTTCVNPLPLSHSAITPLIAQFACDIRTDLGTATDVANNIAQQCLLDYTSNADIINNPGNLAQDNANKWIVICDLLDRIKFIEDTFCVPTCDDIKIGFSATYLAGSNQLVLTFANNTGTTIPIGFNDTGSTITFTDQDNNTITLPIILSNGLVWTSPSLSLNFYSPITVKIQSSFTYNSNGLICLDCFVQTLPAQETECKICEICAKDGAPGDEIQITYTTTSNTTPQVIVLQPNACLSFSVPGNEPIISNVTVLTIGSSIRLVKGVDCDSSVVIPSTTQPSCWFFPLPMTNAIVGVGVKGISCALPGADVNVYPSASDNQSDLYSELETTLGTIPLIGKTCQGASNNNQPNNVAPAIIYTKLPTYTSSIIECMSVVGEYIQGGSNTWGAWDTCGGGAGNLVQGAFDYTNPSGGAFGITINIIGQNTSVPPMLKIIDFATGNALYSKGVLTPTCC